MSACAYVICTTLLRVIFLAAQGVIWNAGAYVICMLRIRDMYTSAYVICTTLLCVIFLAVQGVICPLART